MSRIDPTQHLDVDLMAVALERRRVLHFASTNAQDQRAAVRHSGHRQRTRSPVTLASLALAVGLLLCLVLWHDKR